VEACELGVLRLGEDGVVVERDRCVVCGMCRDACPTEAISIIGRQVSVEELVREVEKDRKYIMSAAGGVTFSGGEPLMQGDFLGAAAEALKAEGYHIAVETCGYAEYDKLAAVMDSVDLFLYDIKAFSRDLHRAGTVKDNRLILENAAKIPAEKDIIFRVPVIPGYNDGKNEIGEIASFIGELDSKRRVELMPFHNLGTAKYRGLGRGDEWPRTDPPKDEEMYALCDIFGSKGIQCEVV
jgi:pyruvate formate lyase activating enzyme